MGAFADLLIQENALASRASFGRELKDLGAKDERIVALDADLSKSTMTKHFAEAFPERFFNAGIAEANMIGMAAGLARSGKVPFAASFACFLTGRFDQIRMSVSFSNSQVRLVGTHSGVGIGEDGHSQMGLEDLALMRSLPGMTVFQPSDDTDVKNFMTWSLNHSGPAYLRCTRQKLPGLKRSSGTQFSPGSWDLFGQLGSACEVVLISSGGPMAATMEAADLLAGKLGSAEKVAVINAAWIAPFDGKMIQALATAQLKEIIVVEDHYRVAGLGGLLAEELTAAGGQLPRLIRHGVREFGQSGSPAANYEYYGFTPEKIAACSQLS